MTEKLDLRGLICPEPVIRAKKAYESTKSSAIETLVDDEVCVANLERLSRTLKAAFSVQNMQGHFAVTLSKAAPGTKAGDAAELQGQNQTEKSNTVTSEVRGTGTVLFISKEQLGDGEPEFSRTLLSVFLQSNLEGGHNPRAILVANSGVKLMEQNNPVKKVLDDFKNSGTEVLFCGLCVEYYGMKDQIPKEQITNMFAICEYLNAAEKLIQF